MERTTMSKTLTLKQTGFYVVGTAKLLLWNGDEYETSMDPFHVMSLDDIPDNINDGGFGCHRILSAACIVYEDYEGMHRFLKICNYDEDELINAKTGV